MLEIIVAIKRKMLIDSNDPTAAITCSVNRYLLIFFLDISIKVKIATNKLKPENNIDNIVKHNIKANPRLANPIMLVCVCPTIKSLPDKYVCSDI